MFKYYLSESGKERVDKNLFYGQALPQYRGITEAVFVILYEKDKPLSLNDIYQEINSNYTTVEKSTISVILHENFKAGYIERLKK